MIETWRTKLPLKIQIFLWMIWQDRLQTATQLRKRKWDGPKDCKLCNQIEDIDHLLFCCPLSTYTGAGSEVVWGGGVFPLTIEEVLQQKIEGVPRGDNLRYLFFFFFLEWRGLSGAPATIGYLKTN
jgi:hypothetical protein